MNSRQFDLPRGLRSANSARAVTLALTLALGGCQTVGPGASVIEDEEVTRIASPTNIASLTDVVQRNPNDPQAYNMRGSVFGRAGRYQEALDDFNQAIKIDPKYTQAYANRSDGRAAIHGVVGDLYTKLTVTRRRTRARRTGWPRPTPRGTRRRRLHLLPSRRRDAHEPDHRSAPVAPQTQ
jgi:tetratricopeptide (TPR) repeat protein